MKTENKKKLFLIFSSLIILMIIAYSCDLQKNKNSQVDDNLIFVDEKILDIDLSLGKIEKYIEVENKLKSKDITRDYFVDIGESIYPYIKNHSFEIPKEYEFSPESSIELNKSYYFIKNGDVKLILYEWNKKDTANIDERKFKSIFINLEKKLTEKLGPTLSKKIKSRKIRNDKTYRDKIKWKSSELNAYLFRLRDRNNSYNQIRLAIYKD